MPTTQSTPLVKGKAVKMTAVSKLKTRVANVAITKGRAALQKKYDALGGQAAFGAPPPSSPTATRWDFGNQCLVFNAKRGEAFRIMGAIYEKWKALGARWIPETDELATPDGVGRYNHFNEDGASIYWSPGTGACAIWGDIRKRWAELGWERSYLGYPTSDEGDIDESGRANSFQHGWIYWWGDTGAIDLRDVVVTYVGLHAYSESTQDQSSGSDEPYCILSAIAPKQDARTLRSKTYDGVDDRTVRADRVELYRGPAYGLTIGVIGMEHDFGSAEANRKIIEQAVMTNHEVGKFLLQFIPLVGPIISKIAGPALDKVMPKVANGIAAVLDLQDDLIGNDTIALSTKKLVLLATRGAVYKAEKILPYKFESAMLQAGGARYKALFSVDPA